MAIFLLLYIVVLLLFWASWAGALTFLLTKHRLPDNEGIVHLVIFWIASAIVLVISIMFIMRADWVTIPSFMQFLGA